MSAAETFNPDWVSPPGETIRDVLRERNITIDDFAEKMQQSRQETLELLQGQSPITLGTARRLEKALGASVEFWMSREFRYRERLGEPQEEDNVWVQTLPIADMLKFGWLGSTPKGSDLLAACLRFFGVGSVAAWYRVYGPLEQRYSFRTSPSFESKPGALITWLRRGELEGSAIDCAPWNPLAFKSALDSIRGLTREGDPNRFLPALKELCAAAGVAVAIVRSPNGSRASGATRFLSKNRALLLLSFRHLSDDQLWFSFFHEAGHLLLHDLDEIFVEGVKNDDTTEELEAKEREANEFAFRVLIPPEFHHEFSALPQNAFAIARFAKHLGIAPGIVVGQLQFHRRVRPNHFNNLKRRYEWARFIL
jgi:HTH-type transcriptional regulator / antitoxin HigA